MMDTEDPFDRPCRAAAWHARLGAPDCTPHERAAFADWLAENDANAQAYAAIERIAGLLTQWAASSARLQTMLADALADRSDQGDGAPWLRRRAAARRISLADEGNVCAPQSARRTARDSRVFAFERRRRVSR